MPASTPVMLSAGRTTTNSRVGCARSVACRGDHRGDVAARGTAWYSGTPGRWRQGKAADFVVLMANPLEDINTRRIDKVYMNGVALDREAMAKEFRHEGTGKH